MDRQSNISSFFKAFTLLFLFLLVHAFLFSMTWEEAKKTGKGKIIINFFQVDGFSEEIKKGEYRGIEIELISEFIKYINHSHQIKLTAEFRHIQSFGEMYDTVKNSTGAVFGIASISITDKRKNEIQFSPPYMPDVEVLISSNNVPIVANTSEFVKEFGQLTGLIVANTTFDENFKPILKNYLPDLKIIYVANSNELRRKVSSEDNLFGYSELPTYLLLLKKGLKIKRQYLFKVQRQGYGIIFPLKSDWNIPIDEFFNHPYFKPTMNRIIKKYLGTDVKDLLWVVGEKDTTEVSKEILMLTKEKEIQNLQIEKHELEITRQRIIVYAVAAGLVLMLFLVIIIFWAYNQKRKNNEILTKKNQQINDQNLKIEEAYTQISQKNKDITDSITYAKRIQDAILVPESEIRKVIKNFFILYLPKDIVSGDFYYYSPLSTGCLLGVIDCTGHGVPGAFMSMIGNDALNQIINEVGVNIPGKILTQLHKNVKTALRQDKEGAETTDGMDISLCKIDFISNKIDFAGAFNSLYLFKSGSNDLTIINADKTEIGGIQHDSGKSFTNSEYYFAKGDIFYMFSDGYKDQFGGEKNKRIGIKRFKKLLASINTLELNEQKNVLLKSFKDWKMENDQIDDITILGFKL